MIIKPPKLNYGNTIGFVAPSYAIAPDCCENAIKSLESKGFKVKLSKHFYSKTNGYAGSVEERAEDFNTMIADKDVKMLIFGGGEVCNEILPYIDYELIRQEPKVICSYSDSTTILNAVYTKTGLVTFYGASLRTFMDITDYNFCSFQSRIMSQNLDYEKSSDWQIIRSGKAEGVLIGGYLVNFTVMQNGQYFNIDKSKKYILFIEEYEKFSSPAVVSKCFSHLEQSGLFDNVVGLIFGHYSMKKQPIIDEILRRLALKHKIPIVRCEDFGHGENNAVLPIGIGATLDADAGILSFNESGVTI